MSGPSVDRLRHAPEDEQSDPFASVAPHYNRMTGYPARIGKLTDAITPWVRRWNVRTALDAGCGGGVLMLALHRMGVEPVGIDLSETMLALAADNLREHSIECPLHKAAFEFAGSLFPKRFDAVLALGNALVSHESDADMDRSLSGLRASLRPGGHFLSQSLNLTPFHLGTKTLISRRVVGDTQYVRFAVPAGDRLLFTLMILERDADPMIRTAWWENWDCDRVTARMRAAGFEEINVYGGLDQSEFDSRSSTDLVVTARCAE